MNRRHARSPVLSFGERRSWWQGFLAQAVAYAETQGEAGDAVADRQAQAVFAHALGQARTTHFPLPYASAGALKDALIAAAGGLVRAERGLEREILGRVAAQAARGLEQLLTEDTLAQVETWKRRIGED